MSSLQCIFLPDGTPSEFPSESIVCLGNFDGVHLGHRALLSAAKALRANKKPHAACAVLCFRAPSSDFLSVVPTPHLSTMEQKLELFRDVGMDYAFLIDFPEIQSLSPTDFATQILRDACHASAVVCGFNYRFGKGGSGTPETLKNILGVEIIVQSEITVGGETVSSTRIRKLLAQGRAADAATLLSRPYSFTAEIIHGKALGQKLGVPTINQNFPARMLIPRHGVYITDCEIDGKHYRAISNVGAHPTVDQNATVNCETHILNLSKDLYGQYATVSFLEFLRPEQKFESIDGLTAQIRRDIQAALQFDIGNTAQ